MNVPNDPPAEPGVVDDTPTLLPEDTHVLWRAVKGSRVFFAPQLSCPDCWHTLSTLAAMVSDTADVTWLMQCPLEGSEWSYRGLE